MTEELTINPLADVGPDVPETSVREYAAALVRNGISVDEANRYLTARGAAPLLKDSLKMAQFKRDQLPRDSKFRERYLNGDPQAVSEVGTVTV